MKHVKFLAMILALLMLLTVIAGCAGKGTSGKDSSDPSDSVSESQVPAGETNGETTQTGNESAPEESSSELSDWVLESQVPAGSKIEEVKWTYDDYTATWEWGPYGAWSNWSRAPASGSDSRNVESKTVTDYTTGYVYWIYRCTAHNYTHYGTRGYNGCCYEKEEIVLTEKLSLVDASQKLYGYYQSKKTDREGCNVWFTDGETRQVETGSHTEYRYRDREKVYSTSEPVAKESTTEITESETIKNVKKWVKYRKE